MEMTVVYKRAHADGTVGEKLCSLRLEGVQTITIQYGLQEMEVVEAQPGELEIQHRPSVAVGPDEKAAPGVEVLLPSTQELTEAEGIVLALNEIVTTARIE